MGKFNKNPGKKRRENVQKGENVKKSSPVFDLKKAKMEVLQYGLKGLNEKDKNEAMVDMLVKLGAAPPKKKYVNYKDILKEKESEKNELLKQRELTNKFGPQHDFKPTKTPSSDKKERSSNRNSKTRVASSVQYKDGIMKIPKNVMKDLRKIGK